jgi:cytidylate kinase
VASGKSAVGRRLAAELGLPFIDTGLFYRAVTKVALDRGVELDDEEGLAGLAETLDVQVEGDQVSADGQDLTGRLYGPEVGGAVSRVAAIAGVRSALVPKQRLLAGTGVVMAGRDIGTVVFPDADFKFFLTASLDERVRRRAAQFERRGERADAAALLRDVQARDRADSRRAVAPLRAAADAEVVDTDGLDLDQVVELLASRIRSS